MDGHTTKPSFCRVSEYCSQSRTLVRITDINTRQMHTHVAIDIINDHTRSKMRSLDIDKNDTQQNNQAAMLKIILITPN